MQKIHAALLVGGVSAGILLACYAFFFHGRIAGPEGDGVRWNELAISFASGTGLTPPNLPHVVDREPFYAVFAGTVYWFFGSHVSYVLLAQSALLVLALAALTWVLVPVMGVYAAAAVSLATIAAPGVASLAVGSLLAETVALTVSIAAYIVFTSILVRRDWYQGMFIGGVAFGALALTRYIFYPLPIFLVAGVLALKNRLGIENPGRIAVWLMAGFLVPVMLWTAYISMTLGVLAPVGTKGGAELALNMHRAQLSGKNLLAFTVGAVLGDAAGRFLFSGYAQNVEPYFTAGLVLKEYDENLIKDGQWKFLWVVDFPMYEWNDEANQWAARHHIFTRPHDDDWDKLETNPAAVRGKLYDIVLNGVELSSGSIRIHSKDMQERVLKVIGLTYEEAAKRFDFLLEAFKYGAPPHGGMAIGFDRLVALMGGQNDIREFIAFPRNKSTDNPLDGSPQPWTPEFLKDYSLKLEIVQKK